MSLPPVTGKAAPEHRSHSASSLFQPEIRKHEVRQAKITRTTLLEGSYIIYLPVCAFRCSDRRTFHNTAIQTKTTKHDKLFFLKF